MEGLAIPVTQEITGLLAESPFQIRIDRNQRYLVLIPWSELLSRRFQAVARRPWGRSPAVHLAPGHQ